MTTGNIPITLQKDKSKLEFEGKNKLGSGQRTTRLTDYAREQE